MKKLCLLLLFSFSFIMTPAQAVIDLVLTKGVDRAIPIAIDSFSNNTEITKVIRDDLKISGQFRLFDYPSQPVGPDYWQGRGVEHVVNGQVEHLANGDIKVQVKLVNVYGQNKQALDRTFTVPASQTRSLAHHISDIIFEQLTGYKGVFSTRLAYVVVKPPTSGKREYRLEMSDFDGHNPRTLLTSRQPIMSPSWSPDGKQVAYVSFEKGHAEIYVQTVATGSRRMVTGYSGINGAPAWSPDGRQLAVVLTKTGYPKIYTIDIGGGNMQQRTDGYAIDTEPHFSRDGRSLFFTSNRSGGPQIYRLDLGSNSVSRQTFTGNYNARASITPDGKELVLLHKNGSGYNIAMLDLQSGRVRVLTNERNNQSPSVAPNGKMVLFSSHQRGRSVLGIVSSDGKVRIELPSRQGEVRDPAWSPLA